MRPDSRIRTTYERTDTPEFRKKLKALREYVCGIKVEIEKNFGIKTTDDLRLNPNQFPYESSEIEADTQKAAAIRERQKKNDASDTRLVEARELSEAFELLMTAMLWKYLGDTYVVVRTADHDDLGDREKRDGVDNLLINIVTGEPLCALDEVTSVSAGSELFQKKIDKVLGHNRRGGVDIKYGVRFEGRGRNRKLKLGPLRSVPIFYLAGEKNMIVEGVLNFDPDNSEPVGYEKKLIIYILKSFEIEIASLNLKNERLPTNVKRVIAALKRVTKDKLKKIERV